VRLSLSRKILAAFVLLSLAFTLVSLHSIWQMHEAARQLRGIKEGYLRLFTAAKEMQLYHGYLRPTFDQDAASWEPRTKDSLALNLSVRSRNLGLARKALAALERVDPRDEDRSFVVRARADLDWLESQFAADAREVDTPGSVAARRERWTKASVRLQRLASPARQKVTQVAERVQRDEAQASFAALGLTLAAVPFGVLVWLVASSRLRHLRRLAQGAQRLARGDWSERVEEGDQDEVANLGREFNAMAAALEEREARLIRSERLAAIGRMAAHIAHEVRNPLSSIGLNAELLEEELQGSPAGIRLARAIQGEVDRLTALTEEYLRFARLPQPKLERHDVRSILTSLLDFIGADARARAVTVVAEVAEDLPEARVDEGQLRQALLNLCRNAVEAMAGGGTLTVRAAAADDALVVAVSDTGPGIPAEHRQRIFEPFYSTKEHGSGLGLALTQHIIAAHGGTTTVESSPDRGSTFVVRLPLKGPGDAARPGA
jgi:two-component system NtrC family sensor kinase